MVFNLVWMFLFVLQSAESQQVKYTSCDSIVPELAKHKNKYFKSVDDSKTFKECMRFVKEERSISFPILESCKDKKLSDMSNSFRNDVLYFDSNPNVDSSKDDNNKKVTDVIADIRIEHHEMLLGKCKGRERNRLSSEPSSPKRKIQLQKLEEIE